MHDLLARVHHERAVAGDGLAQGARGEQEQARGVQASGGAQRVAVAQHRELSDADLTRARCRTERRAPLVHVRERVVPGRERQLHGGLRREVDVQVERLGRDALHRPDDAAVELPVTVGHNAFAYVYEGQATLGPASSTREVGAGQLAVLTDGDSLRAAAGSAGARVLLLAARPLREPIARYGPFVMNTREEIMQAVDDYRNGKF